MKKNELKSLLKPLVKECIHEVLLEEGVLSSVVAEVVSGMSTQTITEAAPSPPRTQQVQKKTNQQLIEQRKKLMSAVNSDAYNGVDLFENTEPLTNQQSSGGGSGKADLGDPRDSGVDISSLVGNASQIWQAIK